MVIRKLGEGEYAEVEVDGDVVTINGQSFDLATIQTDEQELITVREGEAYVAEIAVPPTTYHDAIVNGPEGDGNAEIAQKVADEFNIDAVVVTLWPMLIREE